MGGVSQHALGQTPPWADTTPDSHCCGWYASYWNAFLLVSTYIVCERLSVMHEPAGVVEILVQILQFTPIL